MVENIVENTNDKADDEEKNLSKWARDPLCVRLGLTKGILYRACKNKNLKSKRYPGTKSLRVKRSDILAFVNSPERVNEVV